MNKDIPIEWVINSLAGTGCSRKAAEILPPGISADTIKFHRQIPGYHVSPLRSLSRLSTMLGLGGIWVKDESLRLSLNSFKVLGGSFAIYNYLKNRLNLEGQELTFAALTSARIRKRLGRITFAAATDGNHGRGVAWAADKLGHESVIYVHTRTAPARIKAIESYGAQVRIIDGTYDDAVRQVRDDADREGWQVVADTSWPGYEEIPRWVMQGYTTLFEETQEQLSAQDITQPTHIFVQAGVGALAASALGFYKGKFGKKAPTSVIVEPDCAACLLASARTADEQPKHFEGALDTIMAGLACGDPSPQAWQVLRECADVFVSCPDYVAAKGMRVYAVPLEDDPVIISGESGAVTMGLLTFVMKDSTLAPLKEQLKLGPDSQVLLINTEGNTDPEYFRSVVWEGAHPVP